MSNTILDQIKARRAALSEDMYADIEIPTWGGKYPRAWFRVKPVSDEYIEGQNNRVQRAKGPAVAGARLRANLAILAAGIHKVVIGEGDDRAEFDLDSPDLLEALGIVEAASRAQVVRALIGSDVTNADGYIMAMSNAVGEHSGYSATAAQESLQGE